MKRVLIVGGGISGLSSAYFLKQLLGNQISISLLEQSSRFGGWIHSQHLYPPKSDTPWFFEAGPRSLIPRKGALTVKLIQELGLQQELMFPDLSAKRRFIYYQKKLQPLPSTLMQFIQSPLMEGLLKEIWNDLYWAKSAVWDDEMADDFDESIYNFACRRFGPVVAERLLDPLVAGVYSGDPKKLSIKSCFPDLLNMELSKGSVCRGAIAQNLQKKADGEVEQSQLFQAVKSFPLYSFVNGVETITNALEKRLRADDVDCQLNSKVSNISIDTNGKINVAVNEEEIPEAFDHVIFTISSKGLASLLRDSKISNQTKKLVESLEKIELASLAVVNIGFKENVIPKENSGFGFLVPTASKDELGILGVTYDSHTFPMQLKPSADSTRLTVMIGGDRSPELLKKSVAELEQISMDALSKTLAINIQPELMHVNFAHDCITQYRVGHHKILREIDLGLKETGFSNQIFLTGASYKGVAINACIENSHHLATHFASSLFPK